MKILLWPSHSFPNIGGLERMVHALAVQLQKEGHEVLVISGHMASEEEQTFTIDGVRICLFPFVTALMNHNLVLMKTTLARIHRLFDTFSPDVVHVHGWFETFCFFQTRILEKRRTPFCLTVHGLLEQAHYRTRDCLRLWSMASAVHTVSHGLLDSLEVAGFRHPQLSTIHNGLPENPAPVTALNVDPPRLLMVGRLSEEKCFDVGFHAFMQLLPKHPGIRLTLVGGGGEFSRLAQLKSDLGLDASIEMTDFVHPQRVMDYMDAASLLVVPSHYESFCLVALEAAFRARPVVASGVLGLREVVDDRVTGLLVPPRDPAALAGAIDRLLGDATGMREMGRAAKERAAERFGIEGVTQRYLQTYEEIRTKDFHAALC